MKPELERYLAFLPKEIERLEAMVNAGELNPVWSKAGMYRIQLETYPPLLDMDWSKLDDLMDQITKAISQVKEVMEEMGFDDFMQDTILREIMDKTGVFYE